MPFASRSRPSAAVSSSTRAPRASRRTPRADDLPEAGRGGERASRHARRALRAAARRTTRSSSRVLPFLFFKGAANGLFAEGAERLSKGVNDQQALLIGIKCERGSHQFFKKYGERFEDSEGKQIFMEFAAEEKQHFELLVREYKNLIARKGRRRPARRAETRQGAPACQRLTRDRSSPPHNRVRWPVEPAALVDLAWRAGIRTMSVTDHDTVAGLPEAAHAAASSGIAFVPGIEITAVTKAGTYTCSAISSRRRPPDSTPSSRSSGPIGCAV
jgi:rubrerythrin